MPGHGNALSLRIHAFEPASRANGPGVRAVIWTQGCGLGCPGCFNPETHAAVAGVREPIDRIFECLVRLGDGIEGVTLSGGEPLQQRPALVPLLRRIRRETALSIVLFTGFRYEEVRRMEDADALRECVDVLIAGRYLRSLRPGKGLLGSAGKTFHFWSDRHTERDLDDVPVAEVIIDAEGGLLMTGTDPLLSEASHGF
jgi:anaerobic ribonucleoside-triphosphate reductase activating protein